MPWEKSGKHNIQVDVNGTNRRNQDVVDDTVFTIDEIFNVSAQVNGNEQASFTQQDDATYNFQIDTSADEIYFFAGIVAYEGGNTRFGSGSLDDANGNTIFGWSGGANEGSPSVTLGTAIDPALPRSDWSTSTEGAASNEFVEIWGPYEPGININQVTQDGTLPSGDQTYNVQVNVNGSQKVNSDITSDETFAIDEIFNTDINVNGTNEGSFNQQSDSVYNVNASVDNSNTTRVTVYNDSVDADISNEDSITRTGQSLSWTVPPEFDGFTGTTSVSASSSGTVSEEHQSSSSDISSNPFNAGDTCSASYYLTPVQFNEAHGSASITVKVDIPLDPQVQVDGVTQN